MLAHLLTILSGRNLPKIGQPRSPEPSTINEKTIAGLHARGGADGDFAAQAGGR
jgi:hypothetical protein